MEKKKTNKKNDTKKKDSKTFEISVDTVKNVSIIVLILIIVLGGSYMASNGSENYAKQSATSSTESGNNASSAIEQESNSISDEERLELDDIDVSDYLDLMDSEEPSVIYVMRTGCSWCALEDPIMEHIKYQYSDAPIYRLDIADFEDDDSSKFAESDDMFSGNNWGTPTTVIVKDGKVVDSVSGAATSDALIELFKNNGIISE